MSKESSIEKMAESFIGLTKKRAQDRAEANNLIFRLIRIDGENYLPYPTDAEQYDERVCIEIDAGVVTKSTMK